MSSTMTKTNQSLIQLAQTIHLKETISFQINSEYLQHNFSLIKQCLLKVHEMQNDMSKQKAQQQGFEKMCNDLQSRLSYNEKQIHQHDSKIKQLQNNIGDDFMKKLYNIQTKTKNTYDFDQTVRRLEQLNKFVPQDKFRQQGTIVNDVLSQIGRLKQQLNRYVEKASFQLLKQSQSSAVQEIKSQIKNLQSKKEQMEQSIKEIQDNCSKACDEVKQNSRMIKQINFTQLFDKIKKIKEDTDHKIGELSIKLKKKCALSDLTELQNSMIQRLDRFFVFYQKGKASTNQTKNALLYLQKRITQIYEMLTSKQKDQQNDALFSTKKVNCASCTKDLGKYEGKLGQFRPWAIFPCKQLDPQKTGGYGFLTYVDKMHNRRGSVTDDSGMERLNRTFFQRVQEDYSPRKAGTTTRTRTTSFMNSFGQDMKNTVSLKQEYFKDVKSEKTGSKFFRVKKDIAKPSTAMESVKQKYKQI